MATETVGHAFSRVWSRLEEGGLLLRADARLPSLVTIVAQRPIAGS